MCSTKQNRGETWILEHCTTNNSNSDTVATANEESTTTDTSQIQSTVAIVLSLNFQDRQPDPPPYTELNVPVQPMATNFRPYEIDINKRKSVFEGRNILHMIILRPLTFTFLIIHYIITNFLNCQVIRLS